MADETTTADVAEPARVVDALGMACPLPVIELAKAIGEVEVGAVVRLLADDAAAAVDVPVWCRMRRQKLLSRDERADGALVFDVRKAREV